MVFVDIAIDVLSDLFVLIAIEALSSGGDIEGIYLTLGFGHISDNVVARRHVSDADAVLIVIIIGDVLASRDRSSANPGAEQRSSLPKGSRNASLVSDKALL